MKLETKHVLPYVLHGVELITEGGARFKVEPSHFPNGWVNEFGSKLLLRPLSDLTKEIEVDGEKFVPYKKMESELLAEGNLTFGKSEYGWVGFYSKEHGINLPIYFDFDNKIMGECDFMFYEMMCMWHFDINNLIGQSLAIDINTIK